MHRTLAFSALTSCLLLASCGGPETTTTSGTAGAATTTGGSGGSGAEGGSGGATITATNGGAGGSGAGGSGGGTTTTTGTPGECTPDEMEACYTGPAATLGQGICKGGMRKCKADGSWGLCLGEVTPLSEACTTPGDDDCDGQVNEEGEGCVCVPGTLGDCYSGPPGTQDVGNCVGGKAPCNADGLGYGGCVGQMLPAPESCVAASDEDCNGVALACTGDDLWHKRFGDAGVQTAAAIAASNGGAVIAGAFAGSVDFGGGALASGGANDAFVASYDYLGAHEWSKRFGDVAAQAATGVAVDGDGNVFVVGDYAGKIDAGGGMQTSAGLTDVFLVKYSANGAFLWSKSFGDTKAQNAFGVATDAQGRVAITGSFIGDLQFGGDLLTSAGVADVFVAVFDTDGGHVWSKRFGDAAAQTGKAIAFGPLGEVVIAGDAAGTVDFGGGGLVTAGATDVFVASFDAAGAPLWSKVFGNNVAQVANAVALDSVGNVVVAASFAGTINFGGGALTTAGGNDVGLAKFTTGGMPLWSKRFGAAGADIARGVAVDPFGTVTLAGDFTGSVNFGGAAALASAGATDVFVAKYDAMGTHLWSRKAGDAVAQVASGVAADGSGVFVTGSFAGAINFGGGALTSAGMNDVFLVKLAQ